MAFFPVSIPAAYLTVARDIHDVLMIYLGLHDNPHHSSFQDSLSTVLHLFERDSCFLRSYG